MLSRASRELPITAPARTPEAARLLGMGHAVTPIPAPEGASDPAGSGGGRAPG